MKTTFSRLKRPSTIPPLFPSLDHVLEEPLQEGRLLRRRLDGSRAIGRGTHAERLTSSCSTAIVSAWPVTASELIKSPRSRSSESDGEGIHKIVQFQRRESRGNADTLEGKAMPGALVSNRHFYFGTSDGRCTQRLYVFHRTLFVQWRKMLALIRSRLTRISEIVNIYE